MYFKVLFILTLLGLTIYLLLASTFSFQKDVFETLYPKPPTQAALTNTYQPKVLLVIYNPVLEAQGGQKLVQYRNWNNPDTLTQQFIQDMQTATAGVVNYTIAQRLEINGIPQKTDGFQDSDETYINCLNSGGPQCHDPSIANYQAMIASVDACGKRNRGEIDELWVFGGPWLDSTNQT